MLEKLNKLFLEMSFSKTNGVNTHLGNLVTFFEQEFRDNHHAFNSAIDLAVEILNSRKREIEVKEEKPPENP